jgi:uncharacterized RDD family membrane protein YckC
MDETFRISTPEQVAVDYELAGGGSRFIAFIIDTLILLAGLLILFLVLVLLRLEAQLLVIGIGVPLVHIAYHLVFEIVWSGSSPGKNLVQIRVISEDGTPLTLRLVLIRNLLRPLDFLPAFYLLGMACIVWSARNQRFGDLAAGTVLIRARRIELKDLQDPFRNESYATLDTHAFAFLPNGTSDFVSEDIWVLKEYFLRRQRLGKEVGRRLLKELTENYGRKSGMPIPAGAEERFLYELYLYLRDGD